MCQLIEFHFLKILATIMLLKSHEDSGVLLRQNPKLDLMIYILSPLAFGLRDPNKIHFCVPFIVNGI